MHKIFTLLTAMLLMSVSFAQSGNEASEANHPETRSRTWVGISNFEVTVTNTPGQKYIMCFDEGELTPGYTIDKVRFYFRSNYGSTTYNPNFNVQIYTGGNRNWVGRNIHSALTNTENTYTTNAADMGTLQHSQSFTAGGTGTQVVNLTEPFEIPANGEVWIAIECEGEACIGANRPTDTATVWTDFLRDASTDDEFHLEVPLYRTTSNGEIIVLPYQYCIAVEVNDRIDRSDFSATFYNPDYNWTSNTTPITEKVINFEETYDTYFRVQTEIFHAGPDSATSRLIGHFIFTDATGQTLTIDTTLRTASDAPTAPNRRWILGEYAPGMPLISYSTLSNMTFPVELAFILDYAGVETDPTNDTARLTLIDEASFNVYDTTTVHICNTSYYWEGYYYYQSGVYTVSYPRAEYGDSIKVLNLFIHYDTINELYVTACDAYIWDGQTYANNGNYLQRYQSQYGCDSTVYLYLTIIRSEQSAFADTACDSYTWNDSTYTRSGSYTQYFPAANGCDSIVTLLLTIHNSDNIELYDTIFAGTLYDSNGFVIPAEELMELGDYVFADSLPKSNGCDSIVTLHLNVVHNVGLSDNTRDMAVKMFPNPAIDKVYLVVQDGTLIQDIHCYNAVGAEVLACHNLRASEYTLNVSTLNSGIYFIRIVSNTGSKTLKLTIHR